MAISVRLAVLRVAAAVVVVLGLTACGNEPQPTRSSSATSGTPAPTRDAGEALCSRPTAPPGMPTPVVDGIALRWFVGLGTGVSAGQIDAEKAFVTNYNKTNCARIYVKLELVPTEHALDVLKTEIAAGIGPDVIGPFGRQTLDQLPGMLYDLGNDIAAGRLDAGAYEPAVLRAAQQAGAQTALPYQINPGYMFYNKDLFEKADLPPLPTKVGDLYRGKAWDWQQVAEVASLLTLDKNGKNATQQGFDYRDTVQYGFSTQYADARRIGSLFGAGSLVAGDGSAQIPPAWTAAYNWYYDALWKSHFAVTAQQAATLDCLGCGNATDINSGHVAMAPSWPWAIPSYSRSGTSFAWDMGVLPSFGGSTASPMDVDSFAINRTAHLKSEAVVVMKAIMEDPALAAAFGSMPAAKSMQPAWIDRQAASVSQALPGDTVNWTVLAEMSRYPAIPSHAQYLPNQTQSQSDLDAFLTKLQASPDSNVTTLLSKLQAQLQADFDAVRPLLTP